MIAKADIGMQVEFIVFGICKHPTCNIVIVSVVHTAYSQIPILITFIEYRTDITIDRNGRQFILFDVYFDKSIEEEIVYTHLLTDYFTNLQVVGYQSAVHINIFKLAVRPSPSIKRKASGSCIYTCNNVEIIEFTFSLQG
ncbi:hypothetical protein SDC9_109153 [bioreactor metagenome]|uniref:Uncharacterized protein n=1 Tax=bioreactor metagenome TaxID=1076179 RepID=A0A645BA57_9ZZZZ